MPADLPSPTDTRQRAADMTRAVDLTSERGAGPVHTSHPLWVDLLPPCNNACPTGEDIQAWLALAQAGNYRQAWDVLMRDNPMPYVYFVPTEPTLTGSEVEAHYLDVLRAVKATVSIPVAMKLGPFFSAPGDVVRSLDAAGAGGFVLFNRFHQPDIDLVTLRVQRDLALSGPAEIRLPLLWIGVLAGTLRGSLAASTGVETADEAVKYLLAGADAVMTTSALLRHGVGHMASLVEGLTQWLDARGANLADIKGRMSRVRLRNPGAYERANYIRILQGWRP